MGTAFSTKGVFGGTLSVPVYSFFPITDLGKTLPSLFFHMSLHLRLGIYTQHQLVLEVLLNETPCN